MKNKVSGSGDSIFKKKGFFVALYSCLGAVIVLALVLSFNSLTSDPDNRSASQPPNDSPESVSINAGNPDSYLANEQAWKTPQPKATATPKPSATPRPVIPVTPQPPVVTAPPSQTPPVVPNPVPSEETTPKPSESAESAEVETAADNEMAFEPFAEGDKLIWPVSGDVAMVFSMDKLIYDPTLDEFRTNDDLRISAQEGTPVKASAAGLVLEISRDNVYGNYVVVDHGNGWVAQYGQLMDNVLVKKGDIIKAGQVIGGVGQPSNYGSLNGTHVNLRVTHEDEPVDPTTLLAEAQP